MLTEREIARATVEALAAAGLPGASQCEVHSTLDTGTLGIIVFYPQLVQATKVHRLAPYTVHAMERATVKGRERALAWIAEDVPKDSLGGLRMEITKQGFKWPSGWPLVNPTNNVRLNHQSPRMQQALDAVGPVKQDRSNFQTLLEG